jgi:hypothetical protein
MQLFLRKSDLGSENDYVVVRDGWNVARVRLQIGLPPKDHWSWSVYCYAPATNWLAGMADSLEEAKKAVRAAIQQAVAMGMKDFRHDPRYGGQARRGDS